MEERLLVKRAKRGDVDAFGELYERVYKKLYAYALYTLKNPEDAKDAVSQAVMEAYQTIGKLKKDEAFSGWIFRIVANHCNRMMREYYRREDELTEELLERSISQEKPDSAESGMDVRDAFWQLPEKERQIVGMHVLSGYTTKEIAAHLGLNENTVRSKKQRALQKLKEDLL